MADLIEVGDASVDLLVGVGGGELYADAYLVLRYHWVAEAGDEDALLLHAGSELSCLGSIVDHHSDDGTLRGEQVEAKLLDLLLEVGDIVHQTVVEFLVLVLLLAALGLATMGMAVFADVGVMVLAILNAMRALRTPR